MNTFTIPDGTKELKVNFETKTVEFLPEEEKFNDGDVLYTKGSYEWVFILKNTCGNSCYSCAHVCLEDLEFGTNGYFGRKNLTLATEKQKQVLFDVLAKEGFKWNAETKQIEKLRWRAKRGETYFYFNYEDILKCFESNYGSDDKRYDNGLYFQTKQQAEEAFKKVKELLLSL